MEQEMYAPLGEAALAGFQRLRSERRTAQVASAAALWGDLMGGKVPMYFLQEALMPRTPALTRAIESNYPGLIRIGEGMTMSDFPLLTGDVLDRMMLARYREFPSPWQRIAKVNRNLRDFRSVRRLGFDGLEGRWDDTPEQVEIKYATLSETGYTYAPKKYTKGAMFSFEMLMNDDLGAFSTIPDRLGRGGARTVNYYATSLYVGASGPNTSLYTSSNIISANPVLSVASLGTAVTTLMAQTDADGQPIYTERAVLVVPPALYVTANNIMNQLTVELTTAGGASGQTVNTNNWLVANMEVVVDPYIPIIATSNGNTSWFLFADPNIGRPAIEVGFLTGFSEPQLYQKLANTVRIGGGIDQMAGDFSTMSQEYKGVIAFGGAILDPKATVMSDGKAS